MHKATSKHQLHKKAPSKLQKRKKHTIKRTTLHPSQLPVFAQSPIPQFSRFTAPSPHFIQQRSIFNPAQLHRKATKYAPLHPFFGLSSMKMAFSTDAEKQKALDDEKSFKRLIWEAERRGWLELDLIFSAYTKLHKDEIKKDPKKIEEFTTICALENSDLIRWFVERKPVPEELQTNGVLADMLEYAYHPAKPWFPKASGNQ